MKKLKLSFQSKKRFVRVTSLFMILLLLLTNFSVFAEEAANENPSAQIFFDGVGTNQNIQSYYFTGSQTYKKFDGVQTQAFGKGDPGYYAYINVNDSLFPNDKATPVAVTVRYMDKGSGYFSLRYATTTATFVEPEKVTLTDSEKWKEYTFYLDDCCFRNANNTTDIVFATWTSSYGASSEPVYVQWIKVEKCFPQKPIAVELTSEKIGNIFDDGDNKVAVPKFNNISDVPLSVSAKYYILDDKKEVIGEGETEAIEVKSGETINSPEINLNEAAKKFGCYTVGVKTIATGTVDGEEKTFESDYVDYDFSVANLLDKDEELNELTKMNTHWSYFDSYYIPEKDMPLMVQAGISGARDAIQWSGIERAAGTFDSDRFDSFLNLAKEYGLDIQLQLCFSNNFYFPKAADGATGHRLPDPDNKVPMDAFKKYVDFITKKYAEQIYHWEFWNEPNLYNFNNDNRPGSDYAKIAKEIYPIVKKNDPDSSFEVFSTAQIPMDFIGSAVEEGILDYADCATLHPYDWTKIGLGADYYFRNNFYRERMTDFRNYLKENGKGDMKVSVDEIGVSTTENNKWGSSTNQAAVILQTILLTQGDNLADAIYFYEWATDGLNKNDQECNWGFIKCSLDNVPFAAKPSYLMISNFNKYMNKATTIDKIVKDDASVYRFRRSNGEQIITVWDEKDAESFTIDLGTNTVKTMDMYGNITGELSSDNGVYDITASFEPYYILGDFKFLKEVENTTVSVDDGRQYAAQDDTATFTVRDAKKRDLTINTKCVNDLEIIKSEKTAEGEWQVTVKTSENAIKENELEIELFDGNTRVFYQKCHVIITEPFEVKTEVVRQSDENATTFLVQVNVTNRKNSIDITGEVSADFTEIGGKIEKRSFSKVKPGETVTVSLNLPEQIVKRTLSTKGMVTLDYGYSADVELNLSMTNVGYAEGDANMTGVIDYAWWNGGDWFAADDKYAARYYTGWEGKSDASFVATTKWTEDDFYLLLIAKDDVFYQKESESRIWQGDSIQFDIAPLTETGQISEEFTEFGVAMTPKGMQIYRFSSQTMYNQGDTGHADNVLVENGEATLEQIDGEYVYRIRIPWTEIFGSGAKVAEDDVYGFSAILNDNDGAVRYWVEYTSGIGSTKNTQLFGKMKLKK